MPALSKEKLAEIYPTAKTYEELQAEREIREQKRKPKLVAIRIATWTTIILFAFFTLYESSFYILTESKQIESLDSIDFNLVITALLGLISLVVILYLYTQIKKLATKTITATPALFGSIMIILATNGVVYRLLVEYEQNHWDILALSPPITFLLVYGVTKAILKKR